MKPIAEQAICLHENRNGRVRAHVQKQAGIKTRGSSEAAYTVGKDCQAPYSDSYVPAGNHLFYRL